MIARKRLIVANWKMYLDAKESVLAARSFVKVLRGSDAEIVVCPSFPLLASLSEIFQDSQIVLGAQDVHYAEQGPFTGDVSVGELKGLVRYVIVGHSERRQYHGETDELTGKKVRLLLKAGLHPIVCVGETALEHENGRVVEKIRSQVRTILADLPLLDFPRVTFAYEPIWAISPGVGQASPQPAPQDVSEIINLIRKIISEAGGNKYLEKMRVLYGGSVTGKTARNFVAEPGVDGVLVGGASTKPAEFSVIVREVAAIV